MNDKRGILYIIKSQKTNQFYIGSTTDLDRRLKDHNAHNTTSTKNGIPLSVVFQQEFATLLLARQIEKKLKKLKRKDYLKRIIADGVVKLGLSGCSSDG